MDPRHWQKIHNYFFQILLLYKARCWELRSLMKGGVFGGGNSWKSD